MIRKPITIPFVYIVTDRCDTVIEQTEPEKVIIRVGSLVFIVTKNDIDDLEITEERGLL